MRKSIKPGLVPARKQPVLRQLEANIGREDIAASLVATGNPRASRLLDMMLDPAYANLSFGQLCSRTGLSGAEVMRLICQRQLAEGMMRMAYHLPDIMENAALAAKGRDETCARCEGKGFLGQATCRKCGGTGETRIPGDLRLLRLVFEVCGIFPYQKLQAQSNRKDPTGS